MGMDKELLQDFHDEILKIKAELTSYLSQMMKSKIENVDVSYFQKFGQAIDRIYGTAATLGFKDIADFCLAMKEVTYMASSSTNAMGHKKTIKMMIDAVVLLEELTQCIFEPEKLKLYKNKIISEVKRVERMNKQEFFSVTKKSC